MEAPSLSAAVVETMPGFAILTLNNGKANAINPAFLDTLDAGRRSAGKKGLGLLLRGYGRFFSAGLDLTELLDFPEPRMREFMEQFHETAAALFLHPAPVLAEINGHAIGGGGILALCADWRITCDTDKRIGLNEARMGLLLPPAALEAARYTLSPSVLHETLFFGPLHGPEEALRRGMVHEVVPAAALHERALEALTALGANREAFAAEKLPLKREAARRMEENRHEAHDVFLRLWFGPARRKLEEARDALLRKKSSP